jgi:hypothetical protein
MDLNLPSHGGAKPLGERRGSFRTPYQHKALCQVPTLPPGDPWLLGISQDLSLTGIGFLLHRRFDPGTLLTIELERGKKDSWGRLPARVVHSTPRGYGNWMLGCALIAALSEEELHGWLQGTDAARL